MRVAVIINPISGARGRPGVARRRAELARAILTAEGVEHEVAITERAGHASELARTALQRGASLVFAWGGDGTVNEVGQALAFQPAALAIIPAGSGNGLARELGVPTRAEQAFRVGLQAAERSIDVGELNGHLFFNTAGIGFDAYVAAQFSNQPQGQRGPLPYITIGLRALFTYQSRAYELTLNGETLPHRALLIALANSRQYGNRAMVAPHARLDDGSLDLVVVEERPPLALLWDARRLFTGTLSRANGVFMKKIQQVTVTAQEPLLLHIDGEPLRGGMRATVHIHPGALRIRGGRV